MNRLGRYLTGRGEGTLIRWHFLAIAAAAAALLLLALSRGDAQEKTRATVDAVMTAHFRAIGAQDFAGILGEARKETSDDSSRTSAMIAVWEPDGTAWDATLKVELWGLSLERAAQLQEDLLDLAEGADERSFRLAQPAFMIAEPSGTWRIDTRPLSKENNP